MTLAPAILAASPTLANLTRKTQAAPTTLGDASQQWAARPADERFWTLDDAAQAAEQRDSRLVLRDIRPDAATVRAVNGSPALVHKTSGNAARLSPLAFQQLARAAGAPAGYLGTLPAELAADCLRHGWETRGAGTDTLRLQVMDAGSSNGPTIRALTSPSHDLTHDSRLLRRLAGIVNAGTGWRVPPARVPAGYTGPTKTATAADCLKHAGHPTLAVTPGTEMAPSGIYLGDRDSFALLVDDSESGQLDAAGDPLHRFLMVSNSETGTGALRVTSGWLRSVCGNHLLWGAQDIIDLRAVHRGSNASAQVSRLAYRIEGRNWRDDRAQVAAEIAAARACMLAKDKAGLIDLLFRKKIASRTDAELAAQIGHELAGVDGEPLSAWNTAQALTRMSQVQRFASARLELDEAAAKVAQLVSVN